MTAPGTVLEINIAPAKRAPTQAVNEARLIPARGVVGDRYATLAETKPGGIDPEQEVTLVATEALAALKAKFGIALAGCDTRRNVLTEGIDLNALDGRTFRLGGAILHGLRLCEPCRTLEGMTQPGVIKGLTHRGGLRACVLAAGTVRVGDRVAPLDENEVGALAAEVRALREKRMAAAPAA